MALTPSTIRNDLKCGNGSISPGEKCHKGAAQKASASSTTKGLEKLSNKQLKEHQYRMLDDLIKRYPGKIKTEADHKKWRQWAAKQPENAEANAVSEILQRRQKRGQRITATLGAAGGATALALTAGALKRRARKDNERADVFLGNKKLNCGPGSKPCGNACIPKGHKCRASWNKPVKVAATAAALGGAALVGTAFLHPRAGMRSAAFRSIDPIVQSGFGVANIARGNWEGAVKNAANVVTSGQGLGRNLRYLGKGYSTDIRNLYNRGREAAFKARHHRPAGRRDGDITFLTPVYVDPARQDEGKKYTKTVINPETGRKNKVRYGAKGYKIAPGTSKGDRYCARSFGDMKSEGYDCSGAEKNTPLCLSRAKWKCSGKKSRRDNALTPRSLLL